MIRRAILGSGLALASLGLVACGNERLQIVLPPAERAEPVAYPAVPVGEASCGDQPCLSDRQTGELISGLTDALDAANERLIWLRTWIATASE